MGRRRILRSLFARMASLLVLTVSACKLSPATTTFFLRSFEEMKSSPSSGR